MNKQRSGFTLIEILLVVVIIGILSGIVVSRTWNHTSEARLVEAKASMMSITTAIGEYEMRVGKFPPTLEDLTVPYKGRPPFMERLPKDPWGNPYVYVVPGEHNKYSFDLYCAASDGRVVNNWGD